MVSQRMKEMVPIFMLKDAESRFMEGDDGLREFLRTEYGNPDSAWVVAEGKSANGRDGGRTKRSRLRALISSAFHWRSSHGERADAQDLSPSLLPPSP